MAEHAIIRNILANAKKSYKTILLPEPEDDRILKAAEAITKQKIAKIILVGDKRKTEARISKLRLKLKGVEIIDPSKPPFQYARKLFELRQHKGMTPEEARELVREPIYYATMMLYDGKADGLVSGAAHPTAHTFGPALRIIKTSEGVETASTYFLMILEKRILFYADCSLNIDPTAEQLADIAIETADTAKEYGFKPKVAMLSFSTKGSGKHQLADKVIAATGIVRQKRKDITIDGELQVDTALVPDVARMKAPKSAIKGDANVLIFPNLDAGNISYKLTERLAGAVALGPISQGLKKPVNDLSRGCSVKDIVLVVAMTANQARSAKKKSKSRK